MVGQKQHCRSLGIERWPFRTIKKIEKRKDRFKRKFGEQAWNTIETQQLGDPTHASFVQALTQMEEAAEASQGARRRVKIWNTVKRRKTAGMAAPLACRLVQFLEAHPECEVYNGQDLPQPTRGSNQSSGSDPSESESESENLCVESLRDPMNDTFLLEPTDGLSSLSEEPLSSEHGEICGSASSLDLSRAPDPPEEELLSLLDDQPDLGGLCDDWLLPSNVCDLGELQYRYLSQDTSSICQGL